MTLSYSFDAIRNLLPQKYPFIFVDRIAEFEAGQRIRCIKNVSGNEWMFPGHFPDQAIFPGVLIVEGMAQCGILLFQLSADPANAMGHTFLLSSVKSRFLQPVIPGDQVIYDCTVVKLVSSGGILECKASVDGVTVAKAELSFAIKPDNKDGTTVNGGEEGVSENAVVQNNGSKG
nr:3-hydroxyacyl-ACP dehydratase FabZ [Gorillibacterium massiliense]